MSRVRLDGGLVPSDKFRPGRLTRAAGALPPLRVGCCRAVDEFGEDDHQRMASDAGSS